MHSGRVGGDIRKCSVKPVGERVICVTVEVAPVASLKPNHICIVGFKVQCVERTILPNVGLKSTAIAAGALADVRVLVDIEDVPGCDVVDNVRYGRDWRSITSST